MVAMIEVNPEGGPHRHLVTIRIPDDDWESLSGDETYLTSRIAINQVGIHLTAIAVVDDGFGCQRAESHEHQQQFELLHDAFSADGRYETTSMRGRQYVLFADTDC